ncbi:MAG: SBBP repeat-containing protein [Panacibacter sp.]
MFILKLDNAGNFIWAKNMGGAYSTCRSFAMAVDASGNVYTTGVFFFRPDFDPGPAVFQLASEGTADVFISKLDASGNFVWAKKFSGSDDDYAYAIALDALGNIYTTGTFQATTDFDPGPGTYNLTSVSYYTNDMFIAKLDAAGNFVWAKKMIDAQQNMANSLALDAAGNVYTSGYFYGMGDFDPGAGVFTLSAINNSDIFISKLNSAGNFVWAKKMGGVKDDYGYAIAVDAPGNVYTTGIFTGTADFDPGAGTYNYTAAGDSTLGSGYDVFISKLDVSGNFSWAVKLGAASYDIGRSIAVDAAANVYTTGSFDETVDFDPGTGVYNLTAAYYSDVFIQKLNAPGILPISLLNFEATLVQNYVALTWTTATENNNDYFTIERSANGIDFKSLATVNGAGNSSTALHYNQTDVKPYSGISYYRLMQTGFDGNTTYSAIKLVNFNGNDAAPIVSVFPTVSKGVFNVIVPAPANNMRIEVYNSTGALVLKQTTVKESNTVALTRMANGLYFIKVLSNNKIIATQKVIKQ